MTIEELSDSARCPDCGAWLPRAAVECPGCGRPRDLPITGLPDPSTWSRRLMAGAGAGGVLGLGFLIFLAINPPELPGPSPSPTLSSGIARPASPIPTGPSATAPGFVMVQDNRYSLTVGTVPVWFSVPNGRWEPTVGTSINRSMFGPQGAEGIILWSSFPRGGLADPCDYLASLPPGASTADLAAAVAAAPGTDLVSGPDDVTVGGLDAKHVVVTVGEDLGCDPGFLFTWLAPPGGAIWTESGVGDTISAWIVEVDGTRVFIAAETRPDGGPVLDQEIGWIIESIRFDPEPPPDVRAPLLLPISIPDMGPRATVTAAGPPVRQDPQGGNGPILAAGSELLLRTGPVAVDGYDWYLAYFPSSTQWTTETPQSGWVAAGPSGSQPTFMEIGPPRCPAVPISVTLLSHMTDLARRDCLGRGSFEVRGVLDMCVETIIRPPYVVEPAWLGNSCYLARDFGTPFAITVQIPPSLQVSDTPSRGDLVRMAGHVDDPAATDCVVIPTGEVDLSLTIEVDQQLAVLACRSAFVVSAIEVTGHFDLPEP